MLGTRKISKIALRKDLLKWTNEVYEIYSCILESGYAFNCRILSNFNASNSKDVSRVHGIRIVCILSLLTYRIEGELEAAAMRRDDSRPSRVKGILWSILSRHLATVDEKITGEIHSRDGNRSERKEGRKEKGRDERERASEARARCHRSSCGYAVNHDEVP